MPFIKFYPFIWRAYFKIKTVKLMNANKQTVLFLVSFCPLHYNTNNNQECQLSQIPRPNQPHLKKINKEMNKNNFCI